MAAVFVTVERESELSPMVLFRVQLRVSAAQRDRVLKSLLRLTGPTRTRRGCLACSVFVDVENENMLLYVEEWASRQNLHDRLRSTDMRILLAVLDLASEAPSVRFEDISGTSGMECIAAARAEENSP